MDLMRILKRLRGRHTLKYLGFVLILCNRWIFWNEISILMHGTLTMAFKRPRTSRANCIGIGQVVVHMNQRLLLVPFKMRCKLFSTQQQQSEKLLFRCALIYSITRQKESNAAYVYCWSCAKKKKKKTTTMKKMKNKWKRTKEKRNIL